MESWPIRLFVPPAIATTLPALAADASLFALDGFRGRLFTANRTIPNGLGSPTRQCSRQR